jgi:hypothetical protein
MDSHRQDARAALAAAAGETHAPQKRLRAACVIEYRRKTGVLSQAKTDIPRE